MTPATMIQEQQLLLWWVAFTSICATEMLEGLALGQKILG